MTDRQRFLWRLRQRALRVYEILLYLSLGGMIVAIALPSAGAADDEATQCGNIQSSPAVMNR